MEHKESGEYQYIYYSFSIKGERRGENMQSRRKQTKKRFQTSEAPCRDAVTVLPCELHVLKRMTQRLNVYVC